MSPLSTVQHSVYQLDEENCENISNNPQMSAKIKDRKINSDESGNTSSETSSPIIRSALHQKIYTSPSSLNTSQTTRTPPTDAATNELVTGTKVPTTVRATKKRKTKVMSHARKSGRKMSKLWVAITLPGMILAGILTKSVWVVLVASLVPLTLAFLQGAYGFLGYRWKYAAAPKPEAPARGVVKCTSKATSSITTATNKDKELEKPLRLLIIGDSLAIGVGQSTSATPKMPEAIAKSLSKEMGGRSVAWTCHGAPGAPTGWIVKELERSIQNGQFQPENNGNGDYCNQQEDGELLVVSLHEDSSSVKSTSQQRQQEQQSNGDEESQPSWQDRLKQQNIQLDHLEPFDIAVVLTGLNDVKGAFLPFLLDKEDGQLRRQKSKRGGDYGSELQILLQVLERRMRLQLQTLKESVGAATERVRESVDTVMDRTLGREPSFKKTTITAAASTAETDKSSFIRTSSSVSLSTTSSSSGHSGLFSDENGQSSLFPMVVLPGMPIKAAPAFDMLYPLRSLVVPLVDIMDSHKRDLAKQHDEKVLFVEPPKAKDVSKYSRQKGYYWEQHQDGNVLLNENDMNPKLEAKLEASMNAFYSSSKRSYASNLPKRKAHYSLFSGDGVHPTDQGYDFWGTYIADAIAKEWRRKLQQPEGIIQIV